MVGHVVIVAGELAVGFIPINWDLIKNPYNWLIVGLMVVILMLALHLIFGGSASTHDGNQATTQGGDAGYSAN